MAFDPAPSTWFGDGYSFNTDAIALETANGSDPVLTETSAAEANATTGDVREVMFGMCEAMYQAWAAQSSEDRPSKMTISKGTTANADGTLSRIYTINFTTDVDAENVADE